MTASKDTRWSSGADGRAVEGTLRATQTPYRKGFPFGSASPKPLSRGPLQGPSAPAERGAANPLHSLVRCSHAEGRAASTSCAPPCRYSHQAAPPPRLPARRRRGNNAVRSGAGPAGRGGSGVVTWQKHGNRELRRPPFVCYTGARVQNDEPGVCAIGSTRSQCPHRALWDAPILKPQPGGCHHEPGR